MSTGIKEDFTSIYKDELEQLAPKKESNPFLEGVSFKREDYLNQVLYSDRTACDGFHAEVYRTFLKKNLKDINYAEALSSLHGLDGEERQSRMNEILADLFLRALPLDSPILVGNNTGLLSFENGFLDYTKKENRVDLDLLGLHLSELTNGLYDKVCVSLTEPLHLKGRGHIRGFRQPLKGEREHPFVYLDKGARTLYYWRNPHDEKTGEFHRTRLFSVENASGEPEDIELCGKLIDLLNSDPLQNKSHAREIFDLSFPDHNLDDVIKELNNPDSYLHTLDSEQLFLVIARLELSGYSAHEDRLRDASLRNGEDLEINWHSFTEVEKALVLHVERLAFNERIVEVTAHHPGEDRLSIKAAESAELGACHAEEQARGWLKKLWVKNDPNVLATLERVQRGTVPKSVEALHQVLMSVHEHFDVGSSYLEVGGADEDWRLESDQRVALGRTVLRLMPKMLRQIELQLRHPNARVEVRAVQALLEETVTVDFGNQSEIATAIANLDYQRNAINEVEKISDEAKDT